MTANAYPVRCSMCGGNASAADCVEVWPQAWASPMPHCCPPCVALWRAWERGDAFITDEGEMVYRAGREP